jgi:hypothetical protein
MGRRSRKRSGKRRTASQASAAALSTRAERDAARRERVRAERTGRSQAVRRQRPGRPAPAERPPAPWGRFPLSELIILLGIVVLFWGFFSGGDAGEERVAAGLVLASLGGGELALREHLAGFRSHSTLLAGVAAFVAVTAVALGLGPVKVWLLLLVGAAVFAIVFYVMRELFKRRSGGLGFR